MWEASVLAVALAMDAVAVAAVRGLAERDQRGWAAGLWLALLFGGFQAGMAVLGWAIGAWGGAYVMAFDHWIAAGLLVGLGGKMIVTSVRGARGFDSDLPAPPHRSRIAVDLVLALATSIDAAAAGLTLPLLPLQPAVAVVVIGVVTTGLAAGGYAIGRRAGRQLGTRLELVGGVLLVVIGVRILVAHLTSP
jgi:manganese efflux pump family protein